MIYEASTGIKREEPIDDEDPLTPSQNNEKERINEASDEGSDNIEEPENTPSRYVQKNHPKSQILGGKEFGIQTRRTLVGTTRHLALLSTIEPQNVNQASKDECWINVMHEELDQIEKNHTWELVPRPHDKNVIGTKWVF